MPIASWKKPRFKFTACKKKFRSRGNKGGAVAAMKLLENDGLGKLIPKTAHRGAAAVSS